MAKDLVIKTSDDKIKNDIRELVSSNMTRLGEELAKLPPKAYIDAMIKLMAYALPKPQAEAPLTPEGQAALIMKKTETTATLIAGGLPENNAEDAEYEEEEP